MKVSSSLSAPHLLLFTELDGSWNSQVLQWMQDAAAVTLLLLAPISLRFSKTTTLAHPCLRDLHVFLFPVGPVSYGQLSLNWIRYCILNTCFDLFYCAGAILAVPKPCSSPCSDTWPPAHLGLCVHQLRHSLHQLGVHDVLTPILCWLLE